jgi:hypothetical protein
MMMRDGTENVAELELLRAQRAQLASRLKTPWWYVAGSAVVMAVGFAMPIASRYLAGADVWGGLLAIALILLLQIRLARVSGVALGMRTSQYPSGRPWTIAWVLVIFAATAVEGLLLNRRLLAAAIVVGVLATLAGTGCWQGHLRGIRRDLETGRAAR